MFIFPDCGNKKKMKPSTNILNSLIPFDYGTHQKPEIKGAD